MELLYYEQKARSLYGCAVFLFILVLAGFFTLAAVGIALFGGWLAIWDVLVAPCAAFLLLCCASGVYGFIKNEVWRFGIREDCVWWDSPRLPRSKGVLSLNDACKVTIRENGSKLSFTMRDGTLQRVPCCANAWKVKEVLTKHYPDLAVEFIESFD